MKTILLFPGLDAIESDALREQVTTWPEVMARIEEAQTLLDRARIPLSLTQTLLSPRQETLAWFSSMVLAAMAVQVGVFDRYQQQGHPIQGLLGISMGDLARSVCAGVAAFPQAFMGLQQFLQKLPPVLGQGSTYQVKCADPNIDLLAALRCEDFGVAVSVHQSDQSALVAGPIDRLQAWYAYIRHQPTLKAFELFAIPVPLHHSLMQPVALQLTDYVDQHAAFDRAQYPIYSTIYQKSLGSQTELQSEILANIHSTVHFAPTIHQLVQNHGALHFVSIGPAPTLLAFIRQMNLPNDQVRLTDYFAEETARIHNPESR